MFGKSIRFQFSIMGTLYLLFAVMVIMQMFYVYKKQITNLKHLRKTHETISSFLKLEDEERKIINRLRTIIANHNQGGNSARLDNLDTDIVKWFSKIELWKQKMKSWQIAGADDSIENSVFSKNFLINKKRQANAYRKVVDCCRNKKISEAQHILNIEARFMPSIHDTIILIDQKLEMRLQNNLKTLRSFFFIMTIACIGALALLIMVGTSVYRNLITSINKMDLAIKRISSGNFSSTVRISTPNELSFLANSFNNMQNTIKLRDGKIHEDAEDIKKINEFLEQKVISCNRTIEQQDIALKRKNEEIDMTLHMMADELHNRITNVSAAGQELLDDAEKLEKPDESTDIPKDIAKLSNGIQRLQTMSQQLAHLAGIGRESMHIQHLPMTAVLKNISEHLKFHLGMAGAELNVNENIIDCQGDGSMLEQALIKLIENAIKYRSPDRQCQIDVESEMDILFVRYRVIDNGLGIPEEFHDKIFQAFFKIDPEDGQGEGLGLAIVNRIIALHNGRVWVESRPGQGSTFVIELPKQQSKK